MPQFGRNYGQLHGHRDPDRLPANWRLQNWGRYGNEYVGEPGGRYGGGRGYGSAEYRPETYGSRRAGYGAGYGAMQRARGYGRGYRRTVDRPAAGHGIPYGASHRLAGYDVREGYRQSKSSMPGHRAGYGYDYGQYRAWW